MALRERDVETYFREQVREAGGRAYKWTSPGNVGVPDRIVSFPGDLVCFVELKAPGKKQTAMQLMQAKRLADNGHRVLVIDSKQKVDEFIRQYGGVEQA